MLQQLRLNSLPRESCQDSAGQEADWTDLTVIVELTLTLQYMLQHAFLCNISSNMVVHVLIYIETYHPEALHSMSCHVSSGSPHRCDCYHDC